MIIIPMLMSAFVGADIATDGAVSQKIENEVKSIYTAPDCRKVNLWDDRSGSRTFMLCEYKNGEMKMIPIEDFAK